MGCNAAVGKAGSCAGIWDYQGHMWNTDKPKEWQPKDWWDDGRRSTAVWRTDKRSWRLATADTGWTPV